MSTETIPEPNKYVTHFNAVVSNYVETFLVPERKEFRAHHAHYLDVLMREYAKATELLDQMRGECWAKIEIAKSRERLRFPGNKYKKIAADLSAQYPMLAQDITEFLEMLDCAEQKPESGPPNLERTT